ncbi:MAG: hypothetical protein M1321_02565 [Candidatus Marsarchaeota archaeon]|nr:hypothetical protein [Candidatus Marsarchaeota archaeon]
MEYAVTCIKHSGTGSFHCVRFSKGRADAVEASFDGELGICDIAGPQQMHRHNPIQKADPVALVEKAEEIASLSTERRAYASGISGIDSVISAMWPKMLDASRMLLKKLVLGAPMVIRFHNDADGTSGAYALYKSIEDFMANGNRLKGSYTAAWIMNRGITYTTADASHDLSSTGAFTSVEKPLLVIIDFGTSPGSNAGARLVGGKFDIIWIDHHPIEEGFVGQHLPFYINPWQYMGNSDIPAGFLTAALSKTFSGMDTREIENASFIGDYSRYADRKAPGADLSAFLDMVTSDARIASGPSASGITPKEIDSIITDQERYREMLSYAKTKMSDAIGNAMQKLRRYKANGCAIYVSGFDDLRSEDTKYPLPGRFSSKLLEKLLDGGDHAILLLHFGNYVSIRVDTSVADKADILGIIAGLKEKYAEEIESGGGHKTAANIKVAAGYPKEEIMREIISALKKRLE